VLSRLCPHTDLRCRRDDWVPEAVKRQLQATYRWTPSELYELVAAVEQRSEVTPGWEPGGLGHRLWCLLVQDPHLSTKTLSAIGSALDNNDLASAMRLLVIHQYSACDPAEAAEQALIQYPAIFRHPGTSQLRDQITADGFVPVF
jgi:hypothetical protein